MIKIDWLGHSAFYFKFPGLRAVIDPYPPEVGFKMKKVEADVVLVTHNHFDHSYIQGVRGEFVLVDGPGEYEIEGLQIRGWRSYHDEVKGKKRGENTIYRLKWADLALVHLGDLGHVLTDDLVESIGQVDVLFIPVGGFYTLSLENVIKVIDQLEPTYVVPMHYRTEEYSPRFKDIATLEPFLKEMGIEKVKEEPSLILKNKETDKTRVVVLKRVS